MDSAALIATFWARRSWSSSVAGGVPTAPHDLRIQPQFRRFIPFATSVNERTGRRRRPCTKALLQLACTMIPDPIHLPNI